MLVLLAGSFGAPAFAQGLAAGPSLVAPGVIQPGDEHPQGFVGDYEASAREIAARLRLLANGRFDYELSEGASDERAAGTWRFDGASLRLTSDPIKPPRIVPTAMEPGEGALVTIALDLPAALSRQFFNARIRLDDGTLLERQLGEDGLAFEPPAGRRVAGVRLRLPAYDVTGEEAVIEGGKGGRARFRFDANDIGKVAFAATPLAIEHGDLRLDRAGQALTFRKLR